MRKTVGIDIGTTTISAVVMDTENNEVLDVRTVPNDSTVPGRAFEKLQDPLRIACLAQQTLDGLLDRHPDVQAIGLTGQMHGILYLDADGRPLSPLYTWQDETGMSAARRIREAYGIPAAAGYGLITCLAHSEAGELPAKTASLATAADFLGLYLTGRKKPLLHASMASSLGFYDNRTLRFLQDILEKEGLDLSLLPETTEAIEPLGAYRGRPVILALGDNQAAFLGSVGLREGGCQINIGTGSQVSVLSPVYFEAEGIEARPFLDRTYLLTGAALCGGRAYAILEKFFRAYLEAAGYPAGEQYSVLEKLLAAADPFAGGLMVETLFSGTRAEPDRRGSILHINEENFTPANLALGFLQGIARELHDIYQKIRQSGAAPDVFVASGNAVRKNPRLLQCLQEAFEADVVLSPYTEEAACGAAKSAAPFLTYHV